MQQLMRRRILIRASFCTRPGRRCISGNAVCSAVCAMGNALDDAVGEESCVVAACNESAESGEGDGGMASLMNGNGF